MTTENILSLHEVENEGLSKEKHEELLALKLQEWLKEAEGHEVNTKYTEEAQVDYKFYAGEQDSEAVLAELARQKRPNTTFNEIKTKIDTLIGIASQVRLDPTILPREDTDGQIAEVMSATFKFYRDKLRLEDLESNCFEHAVKSGRSLQGFFIDVSNPFKPKIKSKRVHGSRFFLDPEGTELDFSDHRYLFVDNWIEEDEIRGLYPNFDPELIKAKAQTDSTGTVKLDFFNTTTRKFRLVECWYHVFKPVIWFVSPLTGEPDFLSPKDFKEFQRKLLEGLPVAGKDGVERTVQLEQPLEGVERAKKFVKFAIFTEDLILESGNTPYEGFNKNSFPYTLYGAYKNDNDNLWFSAIRMMRAPQIGLNTIMRQFIHLLNTSPKGLLIAETGALLDEDDYKDRSSSSNYILKVGRGMIDKIKFTNQVQIPPIYENLLAIYSGFLKSVSGVEDALLGIPSGSREPGITVQLRQQSSLAVLHMLFKNYTISRLRSGKQLLGFIQQYVKNTEFLRIDPKAEPLVINGVNEDGSILNDLSVGKFDLMVEESIQAANVRLANAKILQDFSQNNPGSIPPDVLLDQTDVSFSAKQRVRDFVESQIDAEARQRDDAMILELVKLAVKHDVDLEKVKKLKTQLATGGNSNGRRNGNDRRARK